MARCEVCFRHCQLKEGAIGFCGGRICRNGKSEAFNYGKITGLAFDPIEKKPLRHFFPGSIILSLGSFGCNLRCPFCQNYDISWSKEAFAYADKAESVSPEELVMIARRYEAKGNIGIAYTYNEPLIGYEFVRDCAKLVHEAGMKNVLVSNGTAELQILHEIIPYIDAMNIDLKGFSDHYYEDILKGNRKMVMDFIEEAVKYCHVELTTLIVPGENDTQEEMKQLSEWVSKLKDKDGNTIGKDIVLHVSRFFPRFHMTDRDATDVRKVYELAETARENLNYVYTGNC
ncbi:MAG: AmmeMemoRadiSam system radical SAM enzyme [Erysipelotrichaceae bacterium]|nr:AmmeMemoRadiSam system radical SAM enzyme [Erysipelotrichaceae bacterium]